MVRLFSPTHEPVHSVKPRTHYRPTVRPIMNVIWAQAVFSFGVQKLFGVRCLKNLRPAVAVILTKISPFLLIS